jgi:hypothetical protein
MSKHSTRHYCRNTHCRAKLAAPVDNEHHAFCTSGCHAVFYRYRCLVCEDAMRRQRDDQRFKNGHKTYQNEYRRFPHVFDYPGVNLGHPTGVAMSASQTLDSSGSKVAVGGDLPRKMFWRDKAGRGWYWESEDLGEHRLFSRSGDVAARLNERGGKWVLTWPRVFPVQQADTEDLGKRLAISAALAALPPDPVTAARLARANTKEAVE